MINTLKQHFATILEFSGVSTMLFTIVEVGQSFWFFCGGVAFLVGAIIKLMELQLKIKKQNDENGDGKRK